MFIFAGCLAAIIIIAGCVAIITLFIRQLAP
jgi:hypothetical protein